MRILNLLFCLLIGNIAFASDENYMDKTYQQEIKEKKPFFLPVPKSDYTDTFIRQIENKKEIENITRHYQMKFKKNKKEDKK